jgi:hypothetical protein
MSGAPALPLMARAKLKRQTCFWDFPGLVKEFSKHGLDLLSAENLGSPSIAKLQHQLLTWRRR